MKKTIKLLSLAMPLIIGIYSETANAAWINLGNIDSGFSFNQSVSLDNSDYVSEKNIASYSLTFNLSNTQTVTFYADNFNFTKSSTEFRQIDLLNRALNVENVHDINYITGIGDYYSGLGGQEPSFSYELGPGEYQVNYKALGQELGYYSDRVVGEAAQGLGNYRLGLNIGGVSPNLPDVSAVPEPETYAMLFAGLALIGVTTRRKS